MVALFKNDDEGYLSWLDRNPLAFLLNVGTVAADRAMLHTTHCVHIREPDPARNHTGPYPKACASTREELVAWAADRGYTVTDCQRCHPRSL